MWDQKKLYVHKLLVTSVITGVGMGVLCAHHPVYAQATESIESQIIAAESMPDKERAIGIWKSLLGQSGALEKSSKIFSSASYVRAEAVADYIILYQKEGDIDHLVKAKDFIRSMSSNPEERAWAYIYTLSEIADSKNYASSAQIQKFAAELFDDIESEAEHIKSGDVQDNVLYGLGLIATRMNEDKPVFPASAVSIVHPLLTEKLKNPAHILEMMHRLAVAGKGMADVYPSEYASLYLALEKKDFSPSGLLGVHKEAVEKDQFDVALISLIAITDKKIRTEAMFDFFEKNFEQGEISRSRRIAEKIDNPAKAVDAWSNLAGFYLIEGYKAKSDEAYKRAESFIDKITKEESRDKARALIDNRKERDRKKFEKKSRDDVSGVSDKDKALSKEAFKKFEEEGIVPAVALIRQIDNPVFRAKAFRKIAEKQTKLNDHYNVLADHSGEWYSVDGKADPDDIRPLNDIDETSISAKANKNSKDIVVREAVQSPVGLILPKDDLVKRLSANGEAIQQKIPMSGVSDIGVSYYENNLYNSKFFEVAGNADFVNAQGVAVPEAIVIQSGVADIPEIYDYLQSHGYKDSMEKMGKIYLLRRPLVVGPKAALVISGADVEALRMSTEARAYIVTSGKLYVSDTKLIGWNESKDEPMWATYAEKRNFRPFITGWSQSEMYIGNTELVALGYGNGKSYGVAFSAGPNIWFKYGNDPLAKRPTGIMADNSLRNLLYGFYSYEADDVVLSGNEYIDNIVYGIDPHDRSHRLAIGYNTAYDTHKKHGIIISREVDNSIIFGNVTFDNKGTGIMLDRDSNATFVYGNTSFHNHQDGITLFESDCEILAANNIFENKGSGFRIRNSYNVGVFYNNLSRNGASGISAYEATLKGSASQIYRDFSLDPYDELTSVTLVGNKIAKNGTGLNIDKVDGFFLKGNEFIDQSPKVIRGAMFKDNPEFLFRYDQKNTGVSVNSTCPDLTELLYVQSCKYRKNGTLRDDGLDYLTDRIKASACAQSTTTDKRVVHKAVAEGDDENEE